jgi:hypothetical protein
MCVCVCVCVYVCVCMCERMCVYVYDLCVALQILRHPSPQGESGEDRHHDGIEEAVLGAHVAEGGVIRLIEGQEQPVAHLCVCMCVCVCV